MKFKNSLMILIFFNACLVYSQAYPDQFYSNQYNSLIDRIDTLNNIQISSDGKHILLKDGSTTGWVIFTADSSEELFNRGLPSWNGHVPNDNSSFMVQMRFKSGENWSPWLTVGFWKAYIWTSYGSTSYSGGYIDYDYVKLNNYHKIWQFKVLLKRRNANEPSPEIHKLSFFVSDTRTTANIDYSALLNDKPDEIFIPTDHYYQYDLDDDIGGDICSPTSVSMVLRSYQIPVDPVKFARDNYDPYWGIFGMWPRAVQNGSEYGLNGSVTRYRSWSEAREVLAIGGRIVMSVGPPLYQGHLMMLAGFDSNGNPLVHDPAKSNGYGYLYNKNSLAKSWFDKGGISYTFFLEDSSAVSGLEKTIAYQPETIKLFQNYPNPFNPVTRISFQLNQSTKIRIQVFDLSGRLIENLTDKEMLSGYHTITWNAGVLPSGMYFIRLSAENYQKIIRAVLLK